MLKKSRKIQAVLMIVLILLTTTASCAATQTQPLQTMPKMEETSGSSYTDIQNSWAYEAITYVLDKGLFGGTSNTTFSPDQAMTRSAFAEVLSRMAGEDSSDAAEIADGSKNLTRQGMAEQLYEYIMTAGLTAADTSVNSSSESTFSTVIGLGLMSGKSDGSFDPAGATTRAEAATVVYRLCKLIDTANTSDALLAEISGKTASIEQYTDYKKEAYQTITLKNSSISFSGTGATVDGNTIIITEAGTYVVSGTLKDGRIIVDSEDDENVRLVLNNAAITSKDGSPVILKSAKNTIISVPAGTTSTLADSSNNTYDEEITGTLFSADDLWINGSGTLTVKANFKDGISGNDDIRITQTKIVIDAADDGIKANDSIAINDADLTIGASGDGIRTSNGGEIGKGYISVNGGDLAITSGADGMQAETLLYIEGGTFEISTTGGDSGEDAENSKGLSAGCGIVIADGSFTIDSIDDALHSNGIMRMEGGTYQILSGDDALHADTSLTVSGGIFKISKCYEGIESKTIEITGGTVDLTSSDDGINVGGGNDNSMKGRPGETTTATNGRKLTISGGSLKVNADGDAIDVNGSAYMTGGTVLVNGPTNNGNGALDYDGVFEISGGTLLTAGSSGMAMAPSSGSTQYTIANTTGAQAARTEVKLVDSSGKTIAAFTPAKDYSHVVISSPYITKGSTYTLYAGATEIGTFTISSAVSGDTSSGGMQGGGGMRGNGAPPEGGAFPGGQGGTPPSPQ